jgi:hypothetical protein
MWNVKKGRLYCGGDLVAVRRVVVEMVAGRREGPVDDDQARRMIRLERALCLRALGSSLAGPPDGP